MDAEIPYKFNIVNCEKINSQFNFGKFLQPDEFCNVQFPEKRTMWSLKAEQKRAIFNKGN